MSKAIYKRGDVVRVTEDVQEMLRTQWLPIEYGETIAGKEFKIKCSYPDGSYDLEGTDAKLDNTCLTYV